MAETSGEAVVTVRKGSKVGQARTAGAWRD